MRFYNPQDEEDFKQEQLINEWLGKKKNRWNGINFVRKCYGRKGTDKYFGISRTRSLSEEIGGDGTSTLEDLIIGSDGRDLENGASNFHTQEYLDHQIYLNLFYLGIKEELFLWVKKMLLLSMNEEKMLSLISEIDSE